MLGWKEFGEMVRPLIHGWRSHQACPRKVAAAGTKVKPAVSDCSWIRALSSAVAAFSRAISAAVKKVSTLQSVPLKSNG